MKKLPLTQGQFALVDDEDHEWLSQWRWHAKWLPDKRVYRAARSDGHGRKAIYMHKALLGSEFVDHKNGDTLDNRRSNLRACTRSQNCGNQRLGCRNRSGYKGVSWHKKLQKWRADIRKDGKLRYLGVFQYKQEAALAYDRAAIAQWGEFAATNIIKLKDGRLCR